VAKTKTRIRRTFTSEYKLQAVQLVTEKGFSYAEAARQLGLRDTQIRTWKKQFDAEGAKAFPGRGNRSAIEEEVHRLRAENKRLLQERDLLKKAAAFFAKEST
jgi:transposase